MTREDSSNSNKPTAPPPSGVATPTPPSSLPPPTTTQSSDDDDDMEVPQGLAGALRGFAAATRKALLPVRRAMAARAPAAKQTIRAVGQNRPLAFASEGAVAGESLIPRAVYYGAWGLSGVAICADIYTKYDDAPAAQKQNTALYWTAFHIPASLVVPALIIHQVVHTVEHAVQNPKGMAKNWPPRVKAIAPVAAALLSIGPVVPVVDHAAEAIMEPTLGAYLGLTFEHHHDHGGGGEETKNKED